MTSRDRFVGAFIALILLTSFVSGAAAERVGVFGLYTVKGEDSADALLELKKGFKERQCRTHREGEIQDVQGNLKLTSVNRFFFLECGHPLLQDASSRSLFRPLEQSVGALTLFEGEMEVFGQLSTPGNEREYIIKISYYTNADPDKRDSDLSELRAMTSMRADRFQNEALIVPVRAVGIETPDEVAILFYDSPAGADGFRDANADILKTIGEFNEAHLGSFAYLTATSRR